jgi:hypothetical protein
LLAFSLAFISTIYYIYYIKAESDDRIPILEDLIPAASYSLKSQTLPRLLTHTVIEGGAPCGLYTITDAIRWIELMKNVQGIPVVMERGWAPPGKKK